MVVKDLLTNLDSLSVNTYEAIPYCMFQLFKNIVAICVELVFAVGIARVNFENLSFIITTCLFPFVVFLSGPEI